MRVQTVEWQKFTSGVRMHEGKKTLFYNGETFIDGEIDWLYENPRIHDRTERGTWEVIIILPGVEVIPEGTFSHCINVTKVIMNDSVRKIEISAFENCNSLEFIKLSSNRGVDCCCGGDFCCCKDMF